MIEKPYLGLKTFEKEHAPIFKGRGAEVNLIVANLYAAPVTILYGPAGVGKSSILQAGVVPALENLGARPVYFRKWTKDWRKELRLTCLGQTDTSSVESWTDFDSFLKDVCRTKLPVVMLDQFEDYLDLKPEIAGRFDDELARAIRLPDVRATFLLGIREDRLADLDRLKAKVPKLFGSTVRLGLLDEKAAREAITGPLTLPEFNARWEPELVNDFIQDHANPDRTRPIQIWPVEVQIVFDQIWLKAQGQPAIKLLAESYRKGGDAIYNFVQPLIPAGRTARLILEDLVPGSGHRTTRTLPDLLKHGRSPEVEYTLGELCKQKILRMDPRGGYTVNHDVIQDSVRRWCSKALKDELVPGSEETNVGQRTSDRLQEMERAVKRAEGASRTAAVRERAARALLLLAHDQQRSIKLALEALEAIKSSDDADSDAGDYLFRYLVQTGEISDVRTAEAPGQRAEIKDDGSIDVLDVGAGGSRLRRAIQSVGARVAGIVMSPDGSRLAAKLATGEVRVWDLRTGKEMWAGESGATPLGVAEIREILHRVRSVVGLPAPAVPVPATEPEIPFLALENQEAFHVDAIRE